MVWNCLLFNWVKSWLLNVMLPDVILEIRFGSNPNMAKDDTDLPDPDSPTIPTISFLYT